ncbi:MAG TPA: hypothetical protein DEA28_01325 [Firmicutes bacterium]|nr:hypothetical protein [Bacillota bacterium]
MKLLNDFKIKILIKKTMIESSKFLISLASLTICKNKTIINAMNEMLYKILLDDRKILKEVGFYYFFLSSFSTITLRSF